jgi:hypothetical protein
MVRQPPLLMVKARIHHFLVTCPTAGLPTTRTFLAVIGLNANTVKISDSSRTETASLVNHRAMYTTP